MPQENFYFNLGKNTATNHILFLLFFFFCNVFVTLFKGYTVTQNIYLEKFYRFFFLLKIGLGRQQSEAAAFFASKLGIRAEELG